MNSSGRPSQRIDAAASASAACVATPGVELGQRGGLAQVRARAEHGDREGSWLAAGPSRRRRARVARAIALGAICATRTALASSGTMPSAASARSSSRRRNGFPLVVT